MSNVTTIHIYIDGDQYQMKTHNSNLAEAYKIPLGYYGYFPPQRMVFALLSDRLLFEGGLGSVQWQFLVDRLRCYLTDPRSTYPHYHSSRHRTFDWVKDFLEKHTTLDTLMEQLYQLGLSSRNEPLYVIPGGTGKYQTILHDLICDEQYNPYAEHDNQRDYPWPIEMGMLISAFRLIDQLIKTT